MKMNIHCPKSIAIHMRNALRREVDIVEFESHAKHGSNSRYIRFCKYDEIKTLDYHGEMITALCGGFRGSIRISDHVAASYLGDGCGTEIYTINYTSGKLKPSQEIAKQIFKFFSELRQNKKQPFNPKTKSFLKQIHSFTFPA